MSTSPTSLDPLSALFKWLWSVVDARAQLTDIKPGNKVRFDESNAVQKQNVQDADLPELMLTMPSFNRQSLDSTSDQIDLTLRWSIATGTMEFTDVLPLYLWHLMVAMQAAEGTAVALGTGIDLHSLEVGQGSIGLNKPEQNRGKVGHAANLDLTITLFVERVLYV